MTATRRFFFHLIALVTLSTLATGVGNILALLFDTLTRASRVQIGRERFDAQQLSLGLAMIVIAGPLWFFFWRSIQQHVRGNGQEAGSSIRKLYLNLVAVASALTALSTASTVMGWLLNGAPLADFRSGFPATMIVTGVLWFWHWRLTEREGYPIPAGRTFRRWCVYILAGFGLISMVEGLVQLVGASILTLPVWGQTIVRADFWNAAVRSNVAHILLGGAVWYVYWFRCSRDDYDSVLRQTYFYLLAISGGAIAALTAVTVTLRGILVWILGGTVVTAGRHYQFLAWTIPLALLGAAVWSYHQQLLQEEQVHVREKSQSAERAHLYLMSFISLGAMVAGLLILFIILVNLVIGGLSTGVGQATGFWQEMLGLCIALIVVGTPLWLWYWGKVLKRTQAGGLDEWRARSRRLYLYAVVAIAIIALAVALVNVVYQFVNSILLGNVGINTLREVRWSFPIIIVGVPLFLYHWRIVRAGQKRGAEVTPRKTVTLLTADPTGSLAARLAEKLGLKIRVLRQLGAGPDVVSDEDIVRVVQEIEAAPGTRVMVLSCLGQITAVSYEEK